MKINAYRRPQVWHLFHEDTLIGNFRRVGKTLRILEAHADKKQAAKGFITRTTGIVPKVVVGDKAVEDIPKIAAFPAEIQALSDPMRGDLTPKLIEWAQMNWSEEVFNRRYSGRVTYTGKPTPKPEPEKPVEIEVPADFTLQEYADAEGIKIGPARKAITKLIEEGKAKETEKGSGRKPSRFMLI